MKTWYVYSVNCLGGKAYIGRLSAETFEEAKKEACKRLMIPYLTGDWCVSERHPSEMYSK